MIKISLTNAKLGGTIPSLNLPTATCRADAPCKKGCYAKRGNWLYKNVIESLENNLKEFLKENNIKFEKQKKFSNLKDKKYLSYDFYIPSKNLLVEYNGVQHYKFNKFFHKDEHEFHRQLHHDWLKRKYAKDNNINLLVIPYWETVQKYFKLII